jgi:hypothetical protein
MLDILDITNGDNGMDTKYHHAAVRRGTHESAKGIRRELSVKIGRDVQLRDVYEVAMQELNRIVQQASTGEIEYLFSRPDAP